ncbi:MAG: AAA domain-containing protein [Acidobacteria bacterium]|nr:AAA domain-containing protein [Acidobacteriota bacterium]
MEEQNEHEIQDNDEVVPAQSAAAGDDAGAASEIPGPAPDSAATEAAELAEADDVELAERLRTAREAILEQTRKRIIGQDLVVEQVLMSLMVGGNSIITGVPGLAKTLLVQTVAQVLHLDFSRIQFTPDLMPSDITGTDLVQEDPDTGRRKLVFQHGPVFANVVLADEINRTPPKTQAALLEAMQEHRVTVQGETYDLPQPFYVFATQNPIELEGTYPLPEAQLDRFMFDIIIEHLPLDEEMAVVRATTSDGSSELEAVVSAEEMIAFQRLIRRVPVADPVLQFAVDLVRSTRPGDDAPEFVTRWIEYGASVRAAQYLVLGAKARALLSGRYAVDFDDIRELALPVLRHRVLTNFHAESESVSSADVIGRIVDAVSPVGSQM